MTTTIRALPSVRARAAGSLAVAALVTSWVWRAEAAPARMVVLPVVVESSPEPNVDLMGALAKGLAENAPWTVIYGPGLKTLEPATGLKDEERTRISSQLEEAARKSGSGTAAALEAIRTELADAARTTLFAKADHDLAYRVEALFVAALLAARENDRARTVAQETVLRFPGRKPSEVENLAQAAQDLLGSPPPAEAPRLAIKTRPDGCEVMVNGGSAGKAPLDIPVLAGASYQAQAVCSQGQGQLKSFPKRIAIADKDPGPRQEVLDAEFERGFVAEGGQRVRFSSSPERRQLEDSYARRVSERYGADVVVLVSVGELSGNDWLNGRLYLRSGYLNRQGLVRLEPVRAAALGRYLATGREIPGVLRPEQAGALVASSQAGPPKASGATNPWYTDIVGWSFTGAGAIAVTLGLWANSTAADKTEQADAIRGDPDRQQALYRDASRNKFLGGIGVVGGGLIAVTGIVLLIIPEYQNPQGELFSIAPRPGGATVSFGGRF